MKTPLRIIKYQNTIIEKQCKRCGKKFQQERHRKGYCDNCILERRKEFRPKTKHICVVCGKEFYPIGGYLKQKCCSKKCKNKLQSIWGTRKKGRHYPDLQRAEKRICPICNKEFKAIKDITGRFGGIKIKKQRYCSHKCYMKSRLETTPEKLMREFLDKEKIFYKQEYKIGSYWIDFYIPNMNLCIEVDGNYWHSFEKQKNRDKKKNEYLRKKGYSLLRIDEKENFGKEILNCWEKFTGKKAVKISK